jgi:polar amino acid transport system substrate-binding protein
MLKEEYYFFHLGGDNFCIIIENDNALIESKEVAKKIMKMSENVMIINNFEFYISSSIGISLFPEHGTDIETLLKNAETAMYCAKECGKNNYFIFDENMHIRTLEKLDMEKSLRHAIRNEEFVVYYQPQISISSGDVTGMEALVRWNHPRLGFIPPMSFIPLAEETGLIIPIGEQILKIVCKQIKEWQDRGCQCVPIAVNISARQFENADILGTIDKVIKEADINSNLLEIEITETIAMSDFDYAVKILEGLKKRGIKVSLDDFGTGYSSLNYLKKLPINRVKIDKSFVNDLNSGACEEVIAEAVINIAHSMNLSVIAEGIETEEQLEFLKQKDCDIAQGYLFSRPVPNVEAEKLMI